MTPDEALLTAQSAYFAGNFEVANRIARGLLVASPADPRVHLLLSVTEARLGRPTEGIAAGREAWRVARGTDTPDSLRYEIARNTAKAAFDANRLMVAQFWLRRSLDVAPDQAAYDQSGADLAHVRSVNPWHFGFDFEAGPSDNLNGGSNDGVFRIGDFVLGHLSNGSQAIAGKRVSLRLTAERAFVHSPRSQTVLGFRLETVRNRIDHGQEDKAGDLTSRDLDRSRLSVSLRRDLLLGQTQHPLSFAVELGHNWAGGQAVGPVLGLSAQTALHRGEKTALWLMAEAESIWEDDGAFRTDLSTLTLVGERAIFSGEGRLVLGLSVEASRADYVNSVYDAASLNLGFEPGWRVGPGPVAFTASAGLRDYDQFSLGFAHVTEGRHDRSFGVSVDLTMEDWGMMGFAPVLSLRHGWTESNISRYETSTSGISFGVSSRF